MSITLFPTLSEPTVSFRPALPEGIESFGPFSPPNPANFPPPIRPGSPTTIKVKRGPWPDFYATLRRREIREGKKPQVIRRNTIGGGDAATRQTKPFLPSMPLFRRAKTSFVGPEKQSQCSTNNNDDCSLPPNADQRSDRKDSRPSSSGSQKTERRFILFKRSRKNSRSENRPRIDRRSGIHRTMTADDGRDSNDASGTSFDDRLRLIRTLNSLLTPSSSNETDPSGTDPETPSPLDPSPRTSLFCPSPTVEVPKEPEVQWLPMGSAMVAWASEPRSSTWLKDLERHIDSRQKVIDSLPLEAQDEISELKQQLASRQPGCEVYFVERPRNVFNLRTWDGIEPIDDDNDGERGGYVARPGGLKQRMDSARASISKSFERFVGWKNSSLASE